ncbi:hypothetical protein CDD83_4676 [Cordyceps sp. RAO-2017]|nr:hypothetical protein CDD83_4676 [Cordyceps sp. RAO-2017]
MDNHPPSPLIRGHALQPVAPQAAQISPLAAPGQGQGQGREAAQPAVPRTRGTPAQVAALRHGPSAATSPESSSQGGRGSDKKRNKKKKRKADRQAPEVEAYPCIKVEPRSPSPLNAPSYLRANKRQRQSQGQVIELEYEPSYERPLVQGPPGPYLAPQYRDEHVAAGYQGARAYPQRAVSTAVMGGDQGYGREYVDERRLPAEGHARGYGLAAPPFPYSSPRVSYHPRSVSQTFAAADGYREPASSFRDYGEGGPRLSVRPEAEAYPGPAKAGPSRLVVDAFGREYFDAAHPAVHRPSAPPGGAGEGGHVVYERLPPRAVSRHPGPEAYGEGGMVYGGGPGPAYAMPRRVVTQPAEYGPYEYRNSQQREYPAARPMGPPGELMQVGAPLQQRRPVHEGPRGYATRAASMMPVEAAGGRYEVPAGYGRMQSVRPDMGGREYAAGMHGDGPREAMPPYLGDYAPPSYQRPQAARAADEIAFIERPRGATQEIVYADDARREVYR